jgi:hypothetical protein
VAEPQKDDLPRIPGKPSEDPIGFWRLLDKVLDDWQRTARFILIVLVLAVAFHIGFDKAAIPAPYLRALKGWTPSILLSVASGGGGTFLAHTLKSTGKRRRRKVLPRNDSDAGKEEQG